DPSVNVPVLSKITVVRFRVTSNAVRFRISNPLVADRVVEIATTKGIATPRAWGHAVTITVTILSNANAKSPLVLYQYPNVATPTPIAMKVSHLATLSARFCVFDFAA